VRVTRFYSEAGETNHNGNIGYEWIVMGYIMIYNRRYYGVVSINADMFTQNTMLGSYDK
jgi:hypothetical protein